MKKILLPFVFTLFLLLTACNDDQEILIFFDEWDDTVKAMLQKIEAGDVDGARAVFDAQKDRLRAGWKKIPQSRNGRSSKIYMSSTVKKRYDESFDKNISAIHNTRMNFERKFGNDKAKVEKLQNLITEHREIFR